MGSSKRRKPKGQPEHPLHSSPEDQEVWGEGGGPEISVDENAGLVFSLVQIDIDVLHETSEGDGVRIADAGDILQVKTTRGRLGNVPPTSESQVRRSELIQGVVQHLIEQPPEVRVHLTG